MKRAVYAGSFDPVTKGHISVLEKGVKLFDEVLVLVATNTRKTSLFSEQERVQLIEASVKSAGLSSQVRVEAFTGLLVDYCRDNKISFLLRGIRAMSDYENEMQSACMNRSLLPGLETFLVIADEEFHFVSSSLVKEVAQMGRDVSAYVPKEVAASLKQKFNS